MEPPTARDTRFDCLSTSLDGASPGLLAEATRAIHETILRDSIAIGLLKSELTKHVRISTTQGKSSREVRAYGAETISHKSHQQLSISSPRIAKHRSSPKQSRQAARLATVKTTQTLQLRSNPRQIHPQHFHRNLATIDLQSTRELQLCTGTITPNGLTGYREQSQTLQIRSKPQ